MGNKRIFFRESLKKLNDFCMRENDNLALIIFEDKATSIFEFASMTR